jgi:acrylyl-CoA reductase (NADPH)
MTFRAIRADKTDAGQVVKLVDMDESELMDGDVTIRVTHSTVNYKDGLALSGKSPVIRRFPMVLGVDLAGIVEDSRRPGFAPGDEVILTGYGLSETHFGGYAEKARVNGDWLVKLPTGLTRAEAMAIGTAGFTAMLAISLLAGKGWRVVASTGRASEAAYLKTLGADEIIDRATLSAPGKPLGKEQWAAAVDSVGSTTLVNVLAQTRYGGAVAACGLAGGMVLPATVAAFILRGVSLLGIDSVHCPKERRLEAWRRLALDLDREKLAAMTRTIPLAEVFDAGARILKGETRGRLVVTIA